VSRGTSLETTRTAAMALKKVDVARISEGSWEAKKGRGGGEARRMVERDRGRREGLSWERVFPSAALSL
jgi:hypothetical protein